MLQCNQVRQNNGAALAAYNRWRVGEVASTCCSTVVHCIPDPLTKRARCFFSETTMRSKLRCIPSGAELVALRPAAQSDAAGGGGRAWPGGGGHAVAQGDTVILQVVVGCL